MQWRLRKLAGAICLPSDERMWYPLRQREPAGACVSDIFREIDEELRRDNLLKLWSRYGRYVIAVAVVALIIAGGVAAWQAHQLSERRAQSARYAGAMALARAGKAADAATVFASIAREGGGYSILASFEDAAALAKAGDHKGAVAIYDSIADASSVDPAFRRSRAAAFGHAEHT